jgi:hypothetical protein
VSLLAIHGIGALMIYDIAHRIGAYFGKAPSLVYLHQGTKEGAAILGFNCETLDPAVLPAPFSKLTPAEIEDCLCIYKDELRGGRVRVAFAGAVLQGEPQWHDLDRLKAFRVSRLVCCREVLKSRMPRSSPTSPTH